MYLKSILNRVERHKCFVYKQVRFVDGLVEPELEVEIEPRANSRAICSGCGEKRPGYDRLSPRRFQFVPFWNIAVFFVYAMRRVDCPTCGVTVERVPWGEGAHRDLSGIEAIGVDEIQWRSGHTYLTLVYQIDGVKRLLWVAQDRTEQSLRGFFTSLTAEVRAGIRFVCSDMWRQYLNVIAEQIPAALHVLDRFHIMRNMNMALDEVRRAEVTQLQRDGYEPILTKARWCLLKRPENLTEHQEVRLKEILQYNLKSVRAHLLREDFQRFCEYTSPEWAMKFLDAWCARTWRSRIGPMKKITRSLRRHRHLILNWFRARGTISSGVVVGFNGKAKLTTRKAFGFRTPQGIEIALFHVLGRLPEPVFAHRFC